MKQTTETIKVHVKIENGRTVCLCHASNKKCSRSCPVDIVERDKYREWQKTMNNKYGK